MTVVGWMGWKTGMGEWWKGAKLFWHGRATAPRVIPDLIRDPVHSATERDDDR